jgi:hypothetical protein
LHAVTHPTFDHAIAILGGTGDQGLGLALRMAKAGRPVVIGSRQLDRAETAAKEVAAAVSGADVSGCENPQACQRARVVILSVPFEHTAGTLKSIRESLVADQIVVSVGVPLATSIGGRPDQMIDVWQGSCAEWIASLLPADVQVVSAFQNVPAQRLRALDQPVECDVVVSGEKKAREHVMALCDLVPGLRGVDGGRLSNARFVESMTALLIGMSARYRVSSGTGVRFTGLPKAAS